MSEIRPYEKMIECPAFDHRTQHDQECYCYGTGYVPYYAYLAFVAHFKAKKAIGGKYWDDDYWNHELSKPPTNQT